MKRFARNGALKLYKYAYMYLENEDIQSLMEVTEEELMETSSEDLISAVRYEMLFNPYDPAEERLCEIVKLCRDNELALTCVELACFYYINPAVGRLMKRLYASAEDGVTLELALSVYTFLKDEETALIDNMSLVEETYELLSKILYVEEDSENGSLLRVNFLVDQRLLSHMAGTDKTVETLRDNAAFIKPYEKEYRIYGFEGDIEKFSSSVAKLYENTQDFTVMVTGEKGSGRLTAISVAAKDLGLSLYVVDYELLTKVYKNSFQDILMKIIRECYLRDAALVIKDVKKDGNEEAIVSKMIKKNRMELDYPIFITCRREVKLIPSIDSQYICHSIERTSPNQSYELWKGYLEELDFSDKIDFHALGSKMRLEAGQIKRIADTLITKQNSGEIAEDFNINILYRLCYEVLDDGRYENVKHIEAKYSIDELKINQKGREVLEDIVRQVENQEFVYNTWNLGEKFRYGRSITALLVGPPGTGKTMAVHALANKLGLELYKVDISQIADKYIGETQKRLEEVFTKAEKSNMILFFDEADALLGKRSESKDAHDKYANSEIAFILQRMEEFDGILLMATNYLQNIDQAFLRRIRYVINFEIPDVATRKQIWMESFPKEIPLGNIDFDFLAEKFAIAGGNIKNIVFNAIFYGAASEEKKVTMAHIVRAAARENSKDKQVAFMEDFGEYRYLLQ